MLRKLSKGLLRPKIIKEIKGLAHKKKCKKGQK